MTESTDPTPPTAVGRRWRGSGARGSPHPTGMRGLGDTLSPLTMSGTAIWSCVALALVIVTW